LAGVHNVGWLDEGHPFNCGSPPAKFAAALKQWLLQAKANQMRGFQLCRFCRFEGHQLERYQQIQIMIEGQKICLGSSEIWIPSSDGGIFAAPNLILHYVETHSYLPPSSFIEAVLRPIPADWNASAVAESMLKGMFV
jgi:hypothetical protein